MKLTTRMTERHVAYMGQLSDQQLSRNGDGGATRTRDKRKARAAKRARKRNRR